MSSQVRTRRFHQLAPLATGAAVVCMLASAAPVDAETLQTEARREVRWAGPLELIVDGESAAFAIKAHSSNITFVWFPRGVKDWSMPINAGFTVRRWGSKALYITVNEHAPKGAEAGLRVWSEDYQCSLHLRSAENLSEVTRQDSIVVKHGDDKRRELEAKAKRAAMKAAAREAEAEAIQRTTDAAEPWNERVLDDPSRIVAEDRLMRDEVTVFRPRFRTQRLSSDAPALTFLESQWIDERDYLIRFRAENLASQPLSLHAISVMDRHAAVLDAELVSMPGTRRVSADEPTIVGVTDTLEGGILIRDARERDLDDIHIEFHGTVGAHQVTTVGEITEFRAVRQGELENERRNYEALGRITIQVQPMLGVIWLENPLAADDIDATSVKGLGVRVGYGINRLLSLEGELMGASSGEASFNGSMNGTTGIATRNAILGRARIGGVLRLGYQYVPTVRLGLGFQGADHGTRFTPDGGNAMEAPDDGFEVAAFFTFGAGFDVRLTDHWHLGIQGAYAQSVGAEVRSLEAGLHLSYSWQPRADH